MIGSNLIIDTVLRISSASSLAWLSSDVLARFGMESDCYLATESAVVVPAESYERSFKWILGILMFLACESALGLLVALSELSALRVDDLTSVFCPRL